MQMQNLLTFWQQKNSVIFQISKFETETLTNYVISFEYLDLVYSMQNAVMLINVYNNKFCCEELMKDWRAEEIEYIVA